MNETQSNSRLQNCTAFEGQQCIAAGDLAKVAAKAKEAIDRGKQSVLIFDDETGELVELDFRGSVEQVLGRLEKMLDSLLDEQASEQEEPSSRGPGRPKLGVVAREVTLLPRHWDWLNRQPGGASVALRKLVEEARKANFGKDRVRKSQEVTYRFMSAVAGDFAGFEEAARAMFACKQREFEQLISAWPIDIREHVKKLAAPSFLPQ